MTPRALKPLALLLVAASVVISSQNVTIPLEAGKIGWTIYGSEDTSTATFTLFGATWPVTTPPIVNCGTAAVVVPAISTGPFFLRVSTATNSDCFKIDTVNPNGSTIPPGPRYPWAACPKP